MKNITSVKEQHWHEDIHHHNILHNNETTHSAQLFIYMKDMGKMILTIALVYEFFMTSTKQN